MKAYKAIYGNCAQKTEDACDSCHRDGEGGFADIEIQSIDENIASLDYTDFMAKLRAKVTQRDYLIISRRLNGNTLEEIGKQIGISREAVRKIFDKNLRHLREFA
jgi:DNA-directed RNA polymerase sigma subunit (sigma70/sigma32)